MNQYQSQTLLNVNADPFIEFASPEHAYLLGFIWADGAVYSQYKRKVIRIEVKEDDMNELRRVIDTTGKWTYIRRERPNRSPQVIAECANAKLVEFLIGHDYGDKSRASPTKIMESMPENLHEFFLRGWEACNRAHGAKTKGIETHLSNLGLIGQKWLSQRIKNKQYGDILDIYQ